MERNCQILLVARIDHRYPMKFSLLSLLRIKQRSGTSQMKIGEAVEPIFYITQYYFFNKQLLELIRSFCFFNTFHKTIVYKCLPKRSSIYFIRAPKGPCSSLIPYFAYNARFPLCEVHNPSRGPTAGSCVFKFTITVLKTVKETFIVFS